MLSPSPLAGFEAKEIESAKYPGGTRRVRSDVLPLLRGLLDSLRMERPVERRQSALKDDEYRESIYSYHPHWRASTAGDTSVGLQRACEQHRTTAVYSQRKEELTQQEPQCSARRRNQQEGQC